MGCVWQLVIKENDDDDDDVYPLCVGLSVWDGRALWSYGHFGADLSLCLDSAMFWAPWHQSMTAYS